MRESGGRVVYLTSEQISRLLNAARADRRWELYPFILIALHTGMRLMEILSIRRADIDLVRRMIRIPHASADTRRWRWWRGIATRTEITFKPRWNSCRNGLHRNYTGHKKALPELEGKALN
ncbi:MAG: tyrosine-type recombinase/integrase [Candidatus Competibacter sp.]|nr:tyrosine-type recombinase/integrase [Candidatus Competibacter sp.]HRD48557.1 tyrosine-type recombinase/integrase [Candidatus Contendobacter sp.]